MKTIFNKIEPKYLECTTGTCEHFEHKFNIVYLSILLTAGFYIAFKYIRLKRKKI